MKNNAKKGVKKSTQKIKHRHITIIEHIKKNPEKAAIYACFVVLFLLSFAVRKSLIPYSAGDYNAFSSWYDYLNIHGLHSFRYSFSNYNPPYTYFLYLVTLLPISKIYAIKGLLIFFDFLLAYSVYLVVKEVNNKSYIALIAGTLTLFLPSVLLNGALWGQFDNFYTAFVMFSLYFVLKKNSRWAWVCFGIALAIKLQAIFFLPVLVIMMFRRVRWYDAIWGGLAFLILTFPPVRRASR